MSRGLGRVERGVLAALEADVLMSVVDIAAAAENLSEVPEATYRSYARALRSLARAGLVIDLGRGFRRGQRCYASPRAGQEYLNRVRNTFGSFGACVSRPLTALLGPEIKQ